MKKLVFQLKEKSIKELLQEIKKTREEVAKLKIENKINPLKDTNLFFKKRKKLAILLTIIKEKKELEAINKNKS